MWQDARIQALSDPGAQGDTPREEHAERDPRTAVAQSRHRDLRAVGREVDGVRENLEIVSVEIVERIGLVFTRLIRDHEAIPGWSLMRESEQVLGAALVVVASEQHRDRAGRGIEVERRIAFVGGVVEKGVGSQRYAARDVAV